MDILFALQFLTRIPIPLKREVPLASWGRAMGWFPLVGLVIGLLLAGGRGLLALLWPTDVVAALILACWVIVTGGLHLDGWIDCCDGLAVAAPPERRLAILKDVHVGAYGVMGAIILLLLKWQAIRGVGWPALVAAPVLGRWSMVYVTRAFAYARPHGLGKAFRDAVGWRELALATGTAVIVLGTLAFWRGLLLVVVAWVAAWTLAHWAARQLGGGLTGDVYGMVCEGVEVIALLAWGAFIG